MEIIQSLFIPRVQRFSEEIFQQSDMHRRKQACNISSCCLFFAACQLQVLSIRIFGPGGAVIKPNYSVKKSGQPTNANYTNCPYLEAINTIVFTQLQVVGYERIQRLLEKCPSLLLNQSGRVIKITKDPALALEEVVSAFISTFPLSHIVIRMQLRRALGQHPKLKLPSWLQ